MRSSTSVRRRTLFAGVALAVLASAAYGVAAIGPSASRTTPLGNTAPAATAVGATTPFTSLESASGTLLGGAAVVSLTAAPTTQYSSAALEASGHAYVHLAGTGQGVQWTNTTGQPISFLNVRESMPDTPSGGGSTSTLEAHGRWCGDRYALDRRQRA